MREIKFRGKDDALIWHYGDLVTMTVGRPLIIDSVIVDNDIGEPISVDPATVGQFAGMWDCEGCEIYEGDIVKATLKEPSFVKRFRLQNELVGEMFFDNAWWMKERETVNLIPPWRLRYYDLTVIGNVHDNPNLLEADDARD